MSSPGADDFWASVEALVAGAEVVIERPKGSAHPRFPALVYPLDYGYLEGTSSSDGAAVDVWLGSAWRPAKTASIDWVVCTVDLHKRDLEIKVLLDCDAREVSLIRAFHDSHMMRALLVPRPRG